MSQGTGAGDKGNPHGEAPVREGKRIISGEGEVDGLRGRQCRCIFPGVMAQKDVKVLEVEGVERSKNYCENYLI
jgi:hypothetical protein